MAKCVSSYPKVSFTIINQAIVEDGITEVKSALETMVSQGVNLILTSGGTGFTKTDLTPEATKEVLDRQADSLTSLIQAESLKITPMACLSRGICGVKGRTLIVNMPGKPKAVKEVWGILTNRGILTHALNQLAQD
jgi:molybdenum cofactor synthesis domain-containing protein